MSDTLSDFLKQLILASRANKDRCLNNAKQRDEELLKRWREVRENYENIALSAQQLAGVRTIEQDENTRPGFERPRIYGVVAVEVETDLPAQPPADSRPYIVKMMAVSDGRKDRILCWIAIHWMKYLSEGKEQEATAGKKWRSFTDDKLHTTESVRKEIIQSLLNYIDLEAYESQDSEFSRRLEL